MALWLPGYEHRPVQGAGLSVGRGGGPAVPVTVGPTSPSR
jgi:hypothetical protein